MIAGDEVPLFLFEQEKQEKKVDLRRCELPTMLWLTVLFDTKDDLFYCIIERLELSCYYCERCLGQFLT